MGKSVLISVQPKWCVLIASGKKTVEVRKTKPKIETPFKVYIYATKPRHYFKISKHLLISDENLFLVNGKVIMCDGFCVEYEDPEYKHLNYKVIGEFVCDAIFPISCYYSDQNARFVHSEQPYTCLTDKEMIDYLGNGVEGYGWHISNLVIYDKPRSLGEFYHKCKNMHCEGCEHLKYQQVNSDERDYDCEYLGGNIPLSRAPQSWCYVEELNG